MEDVSETPRSRTLKNKNYHKYIEEKPKDSAVYSTILYIFSRKTFNA